MQYDTDVHYPVSEAVWIAAGLIMLLAFGDILVLLALALAIVAMTAAWLGYRKVRQRGQGNDDLASVTQLRPAAAVEPDPKATPAPWQGPSAA